MLFGPDHGGLAAHAVTANADLLLGFAAGTVTQVGRDAAQAHLQPVRSVDIAMLHIAWDATLAQLASWGLQLLCRGLKKTYASDVLLLQSDMFAS